MATDTGYAGFAGGAAGEMTVISLASGFSAWTVPAIPRRCQSSRSASRAPAKSDLVITITEVATMDFWSTETRPRTSTRSPELMSLMVILVAVFKFGAPGGTRRKDTPSAGTMRKSGPASVCNVKLPAGSFVTTPIGLMDGEDEAAPEPCANADPAQTTMRGRIMKPFLIDAASLPVCAGIFSIQLPT